MQASPTAQDLTAAVAAAELAADRSRAVRAKHRGHKRLNRRDDLEPALAALKAAAAPIRRYSGMALAHEFSDKDAALLRRTTKLLQHERRHLRKMIARSPGRPR